jgi:uncharacterized Zn finger protein
LHNEEESPFACKECGWKFPQELLDNLIKKEEETIYCEQCGTPNNRNDFSERQISQKIHQEKSKTLFTLLSSTKKKSKENKNKLETKLKEMNKK